MISFEVVSRLFHNYAASVGLGGVAGAALTGLHNRRIRAYTELQTRSAAASSSAAALYDTILSKYTEHKFTKPLCLPDGQTLYYLKEAKILALEIIERDLHKPKAQDSSWDKASEWIRDGEHSWQNRTAYETAWSLQQIGIAVFSGIAPLNLVLANVADTAIDDWMICRRWVTTYRQNEQYENKIYKVDYHRRHGEWLFCICVLWSRKVGWPHDRKGAFSLEDSELLAQRLWALSRADGNLMPIHVANSIYDACGVWVLPLSWHEYVWYFWPPYWPALPWRSKQRPEPSRGDASNTKTQEHMT
jgi:hypothetical protein